MQIPRIKASDYANFAPSYQTFFMHTYFKNPTKQSDQLANYLMYLGS